MTAERSPLLLRARVVLPIRHPPIEDGAVVISGNRIIAVGRWRRLGAIFSDRMVDLGETILLPGLVNAHCHLDYTDMAGLFPPPNSFCDWVKSITAEKSQWTHAGFMESWLNGARMLLRAGATTVADIESVPQLLPAVWAAVPLRVFSFLEMTGIRSRRAPDAILAEAVETADSLPVGRCAIGLSPHAPYSTTPALMSRCAAAARRRKWRVVTHVSESATEFEMFTRGRGEMFDWLRRSERDMSDCGGLSPVQHLLQAGLLRRNLLAIHVNYLAPGDAALLAHQQVSVVHCPRSHDYFQHRPFPFPALAKAGVNICLGTDSLATVRKRPRETIELNLFDEMRAFAAANPRVSAGQILRLATVHGARALGLARQAGELARHAFADMIALPFHGKTAESYDAVLNYSGPVAASMINGQWAIAPPTLQGPGKRTAAKHHD